MGKDQRFFKGIVGKLCTVNAFSPSHHLMNVQQHVHFRLVFCDIGFVWGMVMKC